MSDWADRTRVLDGASSSMPGPWRTARTPYLREIMDSFRDRRLKKIVLCFGTQLGKSETILNLIGYVVDQDPGPALLVYPTDQLARSISKNRIAPMLISSPALLEKWNIDQSENLELQFQGMYLALVGANSPSKLASRPIRYLFYDEIDKFPERSGSDANPIDLAAERTKNFANSKQVMASSPTLNSGPIWQNFLAAQVRKKYFVPCPSCGAPLTLEHRGIKWPEELNSLPPEEREKRVLTEAWFQCPYCGAHIDDMQKYKMLQAGEWRPVVQNAEGLWVPAASSVKRPESVGYNISSLYSPWLTFGQVAQKFLRSKDDPLTFMNYQNGWLAEPWTPRAATMRSDAVLALALPYDPAVVPRGAQLLTCGVDVQQDHFYYVVRAWGPRLTSWLVDYGRFETWTELDAILDRPWTCEDGGDMLINLCFVDSGYNTAEVYEYCALHPEVAFPSKGSSQALTRAPISESVLEKPEFGGMKLFIIDGGYYKNFIHGRLQRPAGSPGSWNCFDGTSREYADMICAEQKVLEKTSSGKIREVWQLVAEHVPNHYLDCEVYAAAAAERMGVRHLTEEVQ